LVGLTIVAIGTSLPELVTSVVATAKKELDIAIGNVIGSNIFNVALILGLTSTISNLSVNSAQLFDMLVMLGSALAVLLIAFTSKKIRKWQGLLLFLGYAAYLTYIIIRN
jgi:cation:H+ antiporter